jgi:hypothetical protein
LLPAELDDDDENYKDSLVQLVHKLNENKFIEALLHCL